LAGLSLYNDLPRFIDDSVVADFCGHAPCRFSVELCLYAVLPGTNLSGGVVGLRTSAKCIQLVARRAATFSLEPGEDRQISDRR